MVKPSPAGRRLYLTKAHPSRALAPILGGKKRIASWIISHFPAHTSYIEPFCGGANVYFAKEAAHVNVLNDKDESLINLYEQAVLHRERFCRAIAAIPYSRAVFERMRRLHEDPSTRPFDRAVATFAWHHMRVPLNGAWHYAANGNPHPDYYIKYGGRIQKWGSIKVQAAAIIEHLSLAHIECDDALAVIKRYDRPNALFYCDPPYVGTEMSHYAGYTQQDFDALLFALASIKGAFFLSHYANPAITEAAARYGWLIHEKAAKVHSSFMSAGDRPKRTELLITNHVPATLFNH